MLESTLAHASLLPGHPWNQEEFRQRAAEALRQAFVSADEVMRKSACDPCGDGEWRFPVKFGVDFVESGSLFYGHIGFRVALCFP